MSEYSIYDPKVVDDRIEYLNSIFKSDKWQKEHIENKKTSKDKHHVRSNVTRPSKS